MFSLYNIYYSYNFILFYFYFLFFFFFFIFYIMHGKLNISHWFSISFGACFYHLKRRKTK
ncbi:hypothetical protein PFMC_01928 [Plasmodium falciparum CAMP/Malaysia]|uniref:Uncharacterized protein n=1 Tax=Plasmodium falciparum (isolate Camp / Malaysia) TaxID=5835 RepID=A0A024XBQ7_PLAFC|nr:hypothetical protein PFMC_01928 [Plasmodium falciparum CAMP/Malaysia]